jgi:hypothetical protein
MYIEGINPTRVLTAADLPPPVNAPQPLPDAGGESLALGTVGRDQTGNAYILLQSAAAIAVQGQAILWDAAYVVTEITTALLTGPPLRGGRPLAFNFGLPTAAGQRFWALTAGQGPVRVLASAVANARLNSTATSGVLDDDGTAGSFVIEGVTLTVTNGGAPASVNAILRDPHVGDRVL